MTKRLFQGAVVGAVAAAVALFCWQSGLLDRAEYPTWTWRLKTFVGPSQATGHIKLILLDQDSLEWGRAENGWTWPWPREVYGAILDFCKRGGAKVVAFDLLFSDPSVYGVEDDRSFAEAARRGPPFVGALSLLGGAGGTPQWPAEVAFPGLEIENLEPWLSRARGRALVRPRAILPVPELAGSAAVLGDVMEIPDSDGIIRRVGLFRMFDGRAVPTLGMAAYCAGDGLSGHPFRIGADWLELPCGRRVVLDRTGRVILRFAGEEPYERFKAAAVIQSELRLREGGRPAIDPSVFKDCYVFFGCNAPGLLDLRPTPLKRVCPGVEFHAAVLDNLLAPDSSFLRDPPRDAVRAVTILLALLGGIATLFVGRAWIAVAVILIFAPIPFAIGFALYRQGFWWPIVVTCAVLLSLVEGLVVVYGIEWRRRRFLKQAMGHYLSPVVVEEIIRDPALLKLGGERKELTIFFSDLEGFSTFSEKLDPQALMALLNDYLSDMTSIVLAQGGTFDKYVGDAIIAFWNAPLDQPDHALRACKAALLCQGKLAERREEFRARTGVTLKARIGLNTGEVVVGNMGSREQFNYTVLGDAANLASRLEGANKAFGTYLLVSEETWAKTGGALFGRRVGRIRVVGRGAPVVVYEPLTGAGGVDLRPYRRFEEGLVLCEAGRWTEALSVFESLPEDPAARVYAKRCRTLASDPAASWDGIWNLAEK